MSAEHDHDDGLQQLVRGLAEAMYNDPGETPVPMATTDATEVIKSQLTENTGTHFLDSGMYGRHWEENQENPPWERPRWNVYETWVSQNVYHFMDQKFGRDRTAVALEAGLYAYGRNGPGEGDSWLSCMEGFAEYLRKDHATFHELEEWGIPDEFVEDILGIQGEMQPDRSSSLGRRSEPDPIFTVNTYNGSEWGSLSQVLQGTNFGGPYAEYAMIQVHQGADVRGGYTGPRVYSTFDGWMPMENWYRCDRCEWGEAESVVGYDHENLLHQEELDPQELVEKGWIEEGDTEDHPAIEEAREMNEEGYMDGAVFHRCEGPIGNVGFARP